MSNDGDLWYVYMVRCNDGTLYTWIAREFKKRGSRRTILTGTAPGTPDPEGR
jgi:hypothetical protein